MNNRPLSIAHLVFGLIFLGAAGLWVIGEGTDADAGDLAQLAPAVLIGAGVIGLVAIMVNARNHRPGEQPADAPAGTAFGTPAATPAGTPGDEPTSSNPEHTDTEYADTEHTDTEYADTAVLDHEEQK